jgi:hypothetical protein
MAQTGRLPQSTGQPTQIALSAGSQRLSPSVDRSSVVPAPTSA